MDLVISSIKPAILVLTGILVAWMAVSVFGPIYGSLGSFGDNKPQSSAGGKSDTT